LHLGASGGVCVCFSSDSTVAKPCNVPFFLQRRRSERELVRNRIDWAQAGLQRHACTSTQTGRLIDLFARCATADPDAALLFSLGCTLLSQEQKSICTRALRPRRHTSAQLGQPLIGPSQLALHDPPVTLLNRLLAGQLRVQVPSPRSPRALPADLLPRRAPGCEPGRERAPLERADAGAAGVEAGDCGGGREPKGTG